MTQISLDKLHGSGTYRQDSNADILARETLNKFHTSAAYHQSSYDDILAKQLLQKYHATVAVRLGDPVQAPNRTTRRFQNINFGYHELTISLSNSDISPDDVTVGTLAASGGTEPYTFEIEE